MEQKATIINQADAISAIDRAEIDMQIATAKKYPRDLAKVLNNIRTLAQIDVETALACHYNLPRGGGKIEGISVRFAEIVAGAWGNLRVATRIIGNDGKTITAQGVIHDLETNVAVSVEVRRRITDSQGRTYSDDMQVVTGNAAAAIAFRNAVMKIVPTAITKKIADETKQVAAGALKDVSSRRKALFEYAKKFNVTEKQILFYCGVDNANNIDAQILLDLQGVFNAINEGSATVNDVFVAPMEEAKRAAIAAKKVETANDRVEQAMAQSVK